MIGLVAGVSSCSAVRDFDKVRSTTGRRTPAHSERRWGTLALGILYDNDVATTSRDLAGPLAAAKVMVPPKGIVAAGVFTSVISFAFGTDQLGGLGSPKREIEGWISASTEPCLPEFATNVKLRLVPRPRRPTNDGQGQASREALDRAENPPAGLGSADRGNGAGGHAPPDALHRLRSTALTTLPFAVMLLASRSCDSAAPPLGEQPQQGLVALAARAPVAPFPLEFGETGVHRDRERCAYPRHVRSARCRVTGGIHVGGSLPVSRCEYALLGLARCCERVGTTVLVLLCAATPRERTARPEDAHRVFSSRGVEMRAVFRRSVTALFPALKGYRSRDFSLAAVVLVKGRCC